MTQPARVTILPTPPEGVKWTRETELAYLAGIIDGEGSIVWSKAGATIRLQVANTSPALHLWVASRWGGSVNGLGRARGGNRIPCGQWVLTGNRAADLTSEILPYLVVKRSRAQEILARYRNTGTRRTYATRRDGE